MVLTNCTYLQTAPDFSGGLVAGGQRPSYASGVTEPDLLRCGWYVVLGGHEGDLSEWRYELVPPFDPYVLKVSETETALWSADVQDAKDAAEVRERASTILRVLNGALKLTVSSEPVAMASVAHVNDAGVRSTYMFIEPASMRVRAFALRPVVVAYDADGNLIPPPPPSPSRAQRWASLGRSYDVVADMLDHYGRADNWFDIYKTIELAEALFGGEHKLKRTLGPRAADAKRLKQSANFYRHARQVEPDDLLSLGNASLLLGDLMQIVLDAKAPSSATEHSA